MIYKFFIVILINLWILVHIHGQESPLPNPLPEVDSLIQLNKKLIDQQKYAEAMEVIEKAASISDAVLNIDSLLYARIIFNYGRTLDRLRQYDLAEEKYLEALSIQEKLAMDSTGKTDLAWSLNNLAALYVTISRFKEAEELYFRSKDIRLNVLGETHRDYLFSINNIGNLYEKKGDYKKAEQYYLRTKELRFKHLGIKHPDYAWSLNNLGVVYKTMGNWTEAEKLYLEAIEINGEVLGKDHTTYAVSLNNLANLYLAMKQFDSAEKLYLESKEVWVRRFGADHPYVAGSLNNLARLMATKKEFKRAEGLYAEALEIYLKNLGEQHRLTAQCIHNLGELAEEQGAYDKALEYYSRALSIRESLLGKTHPDFGNSQHNIGRLLWRTGDLIGAKAALKDALDLQMKQVESGARHLPEKELETYILRFKEITEKWYSLNQITNDNSREDAGLSLDAILFHKGFILNSAGVFRNRVEQDSLARQLYHQYLHVKSNIARQQVLPVSQRKDMAALEATALDLEKQMIKQIDQEDNQAVNSGWNSLAERLKPGEMVLEFVHYRYYNPDPTDSIIYAAIVLKNGAEHPILIPLFESKQLDYLLLDQKEKRSEYVNELYAWSERGMIQLGTKKASLYDLIWDKIEAVGLEDVRKIYYSPSGILHRLNLGAVPFSDEEILADKYQLIRLNSTRQLTEINHVGGKSIEKNALIMGGIQYDPDSSQIESKNDIDQGQLAAVNPAGFNNRSSSTTVQKWDYLKWTLRESQKIQDLLSQKEWETRLLSGLDGTESTFKAYGEHQVTSPYLIHMPPMDFSSLTQIYLQTKMKRIFCINPQAIQ